MKNFSKYVVNKKSVQDAMNDVTEEHFDKQEELVNKVKSLLSGNSRVVIVNAPEVGLEELIQMRQDPALSNSLNNEKLYLEIPLLLFSSTVPELTGDINMAIRILEAKQGKYTSSIGK